MRYTWQRTLRTVLMSLAGALILLLLCMLYGFLPTPNRPPFPFIIMLVAISTVFWWAWIDDRLATLRGSRRCVLRIVLGIYATTMLVPFALLIIGTHTYDRLPAPVLMWVMAWHLSMAVAGAIGLVIWVLWVGQRRLYGILSARRAAVSGAPCPANKSDVEPDCHPLSSDDPPPTGPTRRAFLTGALAAAPTMLVGSAVANGLHQQGRFEVRRIEMRVPRLPNRLSGLSITHLSDFHVGRFFRPEHLPRVVDAVNTLGSDIIAITGDTVDHSIEFLPPACEAFRQMYSRYGRFIVVGNHDLIDSGGLAVHYLTRHEPHLLLDRHTTMDIGGERVQIGGLYWSRNERDQPNRPGLVTRTRVMMAGADPEVFTIALTHHPHAFDSLAEKGVDLVLAGHTHGGQVMLTPQGSPYPIGGGSLLFRYIWGEYRRGPSAMYVTSGVGNWFPVRINAAAEIVQIRLWAS